MPKPYIVAGLLGASVGVPYLVSEVPKDWGQTSGAAAQPAGAETTIDVTSITIQPPQGPGAAVYTSPAPLEGFRRHSINEVLRFDVTKEWVYGQFARKTTGLADPELFGVRVALVTGTGMSDLAGSLSYYFSNTDQVERITFQGRTADSRPLVQLVTSQYGLAPVPAASPGEHLFESRVGSKVQSRLRTRPQPVLWSTDPHSSVQVDLVLNRPGSDRFIVPEKPQLNLPPAPAEHVADAPAAEPQAPAEGQAAADPQQTRPDWFRWPN
ncbi:hypothetical protein Pla175_20310 [Pirellulimonas nuda]|uniref:DUF6690 domain-containing protein n=1 Tax=Pirellulimonas nuda TaxID=2528009 RepID=A0A518DAZ2_9BACT|nr:DUF6690 family protein [Pirellulimonas nuda]QDU88651.1 hypothetical protein Pla175_20310 [Pirellulimonas nuda]